MFLHSILYDEAILLLRTGLSLELPQITHLRIPFGVSPMMKVVWLVR